MCETCKANPFVSGNFIEIPTLFFTYKVLNDTRFANRTFVVRTFLEPKGNGRVRIHLLYNLRNDKTGKYVYLKANFLDEKVDEAKVPDLLSLIGSGQYIASIPNMKNYLAKIYKSISDYAGGSNKNTKISIVSMPSPLTVTWKCSDFTCGRDGCPPECMCVSGQVLCANKTTS